MFRPRGGLAKVFYEKIHTDARLQSMDKTEWYCIDDERMKNLSEENWSKFLPLGLDDSTEEFIDKCQENSDSTLWQLWLTAASSLLSWFLNPTSINGLLGRGSMHVFSSAQFQTLINWDPLNARLDRLLDIGAGDGEPTKRMESCFNQVSVTEMSIPMKWSLEKKGYRVENETSWYEVKADQRYDVVTCLNVLDRCEAPLSLLWNISKVLTLDGIAIVSFVIPFKPYVEFGNPTHTPIELLPIEGSSYEEEVNNFIEKVLRPNNWEVIHWTRLPYLCEGDIKQAFYWLNDAIFVIRPIR